MEVVQGSFDELGHPLADTTFCVVDLETTGGSAAKGSKITEFGAVKIRGGEVVGEFQSLVNPDEAIPAYITVLTGITNQMVIGAPRIAEVLPSFLEFARGAVLVAHNAPFDIGTPVQGVEVKRTFVTREVMVPFKCNVHAWMRAYVGVLEHPYFAVSDDSGRFSLPALPPGTYTVEIWHERFGTQTQQVTVGASENKDVTFTFKAS